VILFTRETRLKFLDSAGRTQMQGFDWPLPSEDGSEPGAWVRTGRSPILCRSGLHFTWPGAGFVEWANERLFLFEPHPSVRRIQVGRNKGCVRTARLNREVLSWDTRTFAEKLHARLDAARRDNAIEPIFLEPIFLEPIGGFISPIRWMRNLEFAMNRMALWDSRRVTDMMVEVLNEMEYEYRPALGGGE